MADIVWGGVVLQSACIVFGIRQCASCASTSITHKHSTFPERRKPWKPKQKGNLRTESNSLVYTLYYSSMIFSVSHLRLYFYFSTAVFVSIALVTAVIGAAIVAAIVVVTIDFHLDF